MVTLGEARDAGVVGVEDPRGRGNLGKSAEAEMLERDADGVEGNGLCDRGCDLYEEPRVSFGDYVEAAAPAQGTDGGGEAGVPETREK